MPLAIRSFPALTLACLFVPLATGADLLDNTSQATGTIAAVQSGGYVTNEFFTAITFSNTTGGDYALDDMTIGLFARTAGSYDIFIELWSVADGKPDTWVPDMDKQVIDFSIGENETIFLTFDICTFTLPANTSRAIVMWSNAETDDLSWQGMSGNAAASGAFGITYGDSWVSELSPDAWVPVPGGVNLSLYLTGTPVPEPSAYALGLILAGTFGGLAKRRSRREAARAASRLARSR